MSLEVVTDLSGLGRLSLFSCPLDIQDLMKTELGTVELRKGGNLLKHQFNLSSENTEEQKLLDFWCHLEG